MTTHRTKLSTSALVLALSLGLSGSAGAVIISAPWGMGLRDSDRRVPEFYGCYSFNAIGQTRCSGRIGAIQCNIRYQRCKMNRLNAGPNDWDRLRAHERAHARGFAHFGGSPATNPAYYPRLRICNC
jgi:hypothetical protein